MATNIETLFGPAADPGTSFGNMLPRIRRMAAWLRNHSAADAPWIDEQEKGIRKAVSRGAAIGPGAADDYPRPLAMQFAAELEARIAAILDREAAA